MIKAFFQRLMMSCLIFIGFNVSANMQCSQDWACVKVKHGSRGQVDFYLKNQKPYDITITLRVDPQNLVSASGNVITKTLDGGSQLLALSYRPVKSYFSTDYDYDIQWAVGRLNVKHDDDYLYRLPYAQVDSHYVVQGFNGGYSHQGLSSYAVDFAMPNGSKVHAAREGIVVDVESQFKIGGASRKWAPYANFIVIAHSDGSTGEYYHLQHQGVFVAPGDRVKRGQLIGLSGSTGFTSLPHLHFAVYKAEVHGDTQSLPIKFSSNTGVINDPRPGRRYRVGDD